MRILKKGKKNNIFLYVLVKKTMRAQSENVICRKTETTWVLNKLEMFPLLVLRAGWRDT